MRKTLTLAALLLAAVAPAAWACDEFADCQNACPLAKEANQHRSTGTEAVLASALVQKDEIARVVKNLSRI